MLTQSKTAELAGSTVSNAAWQGGSNINPIPMEMTMTSHITTPALGAITLANGKEVTPDHVLRIEADRSRVLRPDEPMKFNTWLDDQPVVIRHHVPIYASCRVLAEWGMSGLAAFVRADGVVAMVVDIAEGAKLTVVETDSGPQVRKYVPFPTGSVTSGRKPSEADQAAIDGLKAAIATLDSLTDDERAIMDGVA